ncbi:MAG: UbiA family prenyltransferase [Myxococcales bacterium]|nr:UbiA family prenyltransferase [Myxococcales bacterium]
MAQSPAQPMAQRLTFWLKVSRPGLWFQTLWLYLLPLTTGADWSSPALWVGLLYATWPLNVLVYGYNDLVDVDIDARNPRKDSWLFGARGSLRQLRALIPVMALAQLPFVALSIWLAGLEAAFIFAGIFAVNATYNAKVGGLRGRPPFDLLNPLGYLLVVQLSVALNGRPPISPLAWLYLSLFVMHAQLIGEIMDVVPDRAAGRVTTATLIGIGPAKSLVIAMVLVEGLLCGLAFGDWVLGGFLLAGVGWLLFDLLVYARTRAYNPREFLLAGIGMNVAGFLSMLWLFWSPTLLQSG